MGILRRSPRKVLAPSPPGPSVVAFQDLLPGDKNAQNRTSRTWTEIDGAIELWSDWYDMWYNKWCNERFLSSDHLATWHLDRLDSPVVFLVCCDCSATFDLALCCKLACNYVESQSTYLCGLFRDSHLCYDGSIVPRNYWYDMWSTNP